MFFIFVTCSRLQSQKTISVTQNVAHLAYYHKLSNYNSPSFKCYASCKCILIASTSYSFFPVSLNKLLPPPVCWNSFLSPHDKTIPEVFCFSWFPRYSAISVPWLLPGISALKLCPKEKAFPQPSPGREVRYMDCENTQPEVQFRVCCYELCHLTQFISLFQPCKKEGNNCGIYMLGLFEYYMTMSVKHLGSPLLVVNASCRPLPHTKEKHFCWDGGTLFVNFL